MAAADLPGDWLERLKIPLVLGVVVLLYGGTQFEETRPFVARTLAYGVPGLALIYGLLPLRHSHGLLRVLAVGTAAAIFLLGALRTREVLRAPAIVARAELQEGQPSLLNPKRGSSFNVEIAARFAKEGDLPGKLRIELRREGATPAKLDLSFDNIRETSWMKTRQLVRVPGSGPIRVAIVEKSRRLGPEVKLVLFQRPFGGGWLFSVLAGLVGVALLVQGAAASRGIKSRLGAGAGAAFGMTFELARSGDASRQFQSALSALIAAFICALVGLVLGGLLTRLLKRGRA